MKFKLMVSALLGIGLVISALYAIAENRIDNSKGSSDIVFIDSMEAFGDLERPGVPFPHDQHTEALEKQGKDCSTCHDTKDDKLILMFKRDSDADEETVLDIYHDNCIGCHEAQADAGLSTGPVACGSCHPNEPDVVAAQQKIQFDASLHHRHIKAEDNTCDSCHHGYDVAAKKVTYVKGEEESCRTCHGEKPLDKALPYREAAHRQCIACHMDKKGDKGFKVEAVAALKCAGCHDTAQFARIEKLETVPRLDREQPDTTFVKSFDVITKQMMDAVIFDHKAHEAGVDSCGTCHHDTLRACDSCHTLSGSKDGDFVTLAQAMHAVDSEKSCVGCHDKAVQESDCAGCHSLIKPQLHVTEGQACKSCHSVSIARLSRDKKAGRTLSASSFNVKPTREPVIDYNELPEEINIDVIADEYEGAKFPHRKIVMTMMDRIEGNALAISFHQGENLVCQSCHHNSPDNLDPPPSCISCHATSDSELDSAIPEMKAAYHQQCFDCHEAMDIEKPASTDCVGCHAEK